MISRIIEWCEQNRFLVFTAVVLLTIAGVWSLRHIPLDALPDISDVQVVIHTEWSGEPPNVIEDQVTYPIVTTLLAAPHVKSVRAQTMFGDSYVFVVFEDGTDLYWARSRVTEYLQQIGGRLPADVHPAIGPDATGAGWVYEYAVIDRTHTKSLADLRALQDWYLRYQLETVPGVAPVRPSAVTSGIPGEARSQQLFLQTGESVSTVWRRARHHQLLAACSAAEPRRVHGERSWLPAFNRRPGERSRSDKKWNVRCCYAISAASISGRRCVAELPIGRAKVKPLAALSSCASV